mmetsp:Transcript_5868/g.18960  ORF Transcript_5868/g.18960 Transcript_5868/m.18960 type:complete len:148 (-) Transcript_5868:562-1005(-)
MIKKTSIFLFQHETIPLLKKNETCMKKHKTPFAFPLNNFKHYFTLFSKFFSSFPRGTCSLSDSCLYLALDEVYHPIRAVLPNNSTRPKRAYMKKQSEEQIVPQRGYHPLWRSFPEDFFRKKKNDLKYPHRASTDYITNKKLFASLKS